MDTKELIKKLHQTAREMRVEGCMYDIADLLDEAARQLQAKPNENEKEIAKPIKSLVFSRDTNKYGGYCPTCEGTISFNDTWHRRIKGLCCDWCGQRLEMPKEGER